MIKTLSLIKRRPDLDRVADLCSSIPEDRIRVAESGIHNRDDLNKLHRAGFNAFLIGEHLVRSLRPDGLHCLSKLPNIHQCLLWP